MATASTPRDPLARPTPESAGAPSAPVGAIPEGTGAPPESALCLRGIGKRFGALIALDGVDLEVRRGEVHCLLGENGAGKSTLCNIVFGVQRPDAGTLTLLGRPYAPACPADALRAGVAMVHQHFSLVGNLTALDNFRLGRGKRRSDELGAKARALCERFGFALDLRRPVEQLSVGERQRAEIVKCLLDDPALLVLDEPTAVLPPPQVAGLLELCRQVAASGCAVLLVTHKLAEIGAVADRTSVLRRGHLVETVDMQGARLDALVRSMVGREVRPLAAALLGSPEPKPESESELESESAPKPESEVEAESALESESALAPERGPTPAAEPLLEVDALRFEDGAGVERLHATLSVRRGEIVGIAGVEGNGQSELAAILSGMLEPASGRVRLAGTDVTRASPRELARLGVGCVSEDRHATGCHLGLSVAENLFLGSLECFTRFGWLDRARMAQVAEGVLREHDVRGEARAPMSALSGGNQQKVVLARELALPGLAFLLAAQPTRGLDVGAVEAVYTQIRQARQRGVAVLLISSELEELLSVCDRVLVMYRGRVVGEVPGGLEQHETVGRLMSGRAGAEGAEAAEGADPSAGSEGRVSSKGRASTAERAA